MKTISQTTWFKLSIGFIGGALISSSLLYLLFVSNLKDIPKSNKIPLASAVEKVSAFRNQTERAKIRIPMAWSFDKDHIQRLVNLTESGASIRFYSALYSKGIVGGFNEYDLKILAVGTYKDNGKDRDIYIDNEEDAIYNFADPCPPKCTKFLTAESCLIPADCDVVGNCQEYIFYRNPTAP